MTGWPEAEGRSFDTADLHTLLADMVADERYPCLGAKSVFRRDRATVLLLERLNDPDATAELRSGRDGRALPGTRRFQRGASGAGR